MITLEKAQHLANDWIAAWNDHNLEAIMSHYSENIHFISPFIVQLNNDPSGTIADKDALRAYFERALTVYPDLKFVLSTVLTSVNSIVLYYTSVNNLQAAEMMELDHDGKVCKVVAHYHK